MLLYDAEATDAVGVAGIGFADITDELLPYTFMPLTVRYALTL
jgi:hypothetical protein